MSRKRTMISLLLHLQLKMALNSNFKAQPEATIRRRKKKPRKSVRSEKRGRNSTHQLRHQHQMKLTRRPRMTRMRKRIDRPRRKIRTRKKKRKPKRKKRMILRKVQMTLMRRLQRHQSKAIEKSQLLQIKPIN